MAEPQPQDAAIEGTVDRIVFRSEGSDWTVARLQVPGRDVPVTIVGQLSGVSPGSEVRAVGRWVQDPRYGLQLRVVSFAPLAPSSLEGLERHLASGLVKGIGPALAKRIVETFGDATARVLDTTPERLTEVLGLGEPRALRLASAWASQRAAREVLIYLQGLGLSAALAIRISRRYGPDAVRIAREEPYRLAVEVQGVGFRTADRIGQAAGLAADAPARLEAGLLHTLSELVGHGHARYPQDQLCEEAGRTLELTTEAMAPALSRLERAALVVIERSPGTEQPFVYPAELHAAELSAAALLLRLARAPLAGAPIDERQALEVVEGRGLVRLAPPQQEALRILLTNKVAVLTGGPGVGKTTLLRGALAIFEQGERKALLAAPTGRAAKRLSEATGRPAQTLHRLLEFSPRQAIFQRNEARPLEADLVVVDEASMLDLVLLEKLLLAIPESARLILVGDADQLPSVGAGAVLRDILASGAIPAARLTEVFRQAARSRIVQNAHRIHEGELPLWDDQDAESDFFFVERDDPADAAATICELVTRRIPDHFGLDAVAQVQVLTPMHRGEVGSTALNQALQAALNPKGPELRRGERSLRLSDKVMQLRNDYDREIFNGDIGRISAVNPAAVELTVDFDGRAVRYREDQLDELTLAYACSVHKAQGSEYPAVVLPLLAQHYPMLQRNLLYTAITRGRRLVIIVGSRRALALAVQNRLGRERHTGLAQRLRP